MISTFMASDTFIKPPGTGPIRVDIWSTRVLCIDKDGDLETLGLSDTVISIKYNNYFVEARTSPLPTSCSFSQVQITLRDHFWWPIRRKLRSRTPSLLSSSLCHTGMFTNDDDVFPPDVLAALRVSLNTTSGRPAPVDRLRHSVDSSLIWWRGYEAAAWHLLMHLEKKHWKRLVLK